MRRHEVISLLGALKTLDPRGFVTIDEPTIQVWLAVLNREPAVLAPDAMATAYELVAKPDASFPAPGTFRALVAETVSGLPTVADARRQVERMLKENYPGMPATYRPDDDVLAALRQIGGAAVFRAAQSEFETARLWREFDAAYKARHTARVTPADGAALPASSAKALKGGAA